MSNTVNLDDYEKLNFLFKNYLGFPNTDKTKPFFLETAVKANNYLFGGEIFLDTIPLTPDFDSGNGTNHNANSLNIDSNKLNASDSAIHTDSSNVVRRFTKIKLEKISGTQRGYYCLDQNNINILKDALQFNVNKADDGTQPYLYKLYTNSGVDSDEQILPNAAGGNWIFDVKNGVVNFPDTITGYNVSESSPPYLTFYKYVGRKGINQLSTSDIVGFGDQTQNIQLEITELSGNILDISRNIYRTNYIDASFNDVYTKATIDSKLTTLEGEIDASFNDVYTKATIDSKLTTLEGEIDASFNDVYTKATIDSKLTTLEGEIDASFNDVYTKAIIDSKLTTLEGEIDASFNDVYTKATIDSKLTTLEGEIDASFNDVYTKATIDSKLTILEGEIDASFNDVYTKAVIDSKLTILEGEIDASFNDVYTKAIIDSKLTTLEGEIDTSFNDVYTKAVIDSKLTTLESEIDASFNDVYTKAVIDSKLTTLESEIDASFNDVYTKAVIDSKLTTLEGEIDASFNDVYTKAVIDGKLTTLEGEIDASFNDVYTKSVIDGKLTTLEGEIDASFNDVYTKSFIDNKFTNINQKADDISQNVLNLDATLRSYVDGLVSGLDVKHSVKAATIDASNVNLNSIYTVSNPLIIDGIIINDKDRILLKNQTNKRENGIYDLSGNSLVRSSDFNTSDNISYGAFTFVELGNINNDKGFILTKGTTSPEVVTVGNTELDFSQFSGAGQIVAGNGLAKNGEVISVNVDSSTINITNDILHIHNDFIRQIDNSFNNVYIKSEINNRFTNLETEIDTSFNDIYTKAVIDSKLTTLEGEIDTSFNDVYTKAVIDSKLTTLEGEIDISFNDVYTKAVIDSKLTTLEGEIDTSFNDVYTKAVIDSKLTTLEGEIDISFNDVYTKAVIDSKLTTLEGEIDISFNNLEVSIQDLESNSSFTSSWILGAVGSSSYTFDGPGLNSSIENPTLYLVRGQKYKFKNRSGGHPFRIQSDENGTNYDSGVTNNSGGNDKDIIFEVPMSAPSKLWYQCTAHPLMIGIIYIGDKIFDLSSNHATLVSTVSDLSSNHATLVSTVSDLSSNHASIVSTVSDLSSNHASLLSTVNDLSSNHATLISTVSDLSNNINENYIRQGTIDVSNIEISGNLVPTIDKHFSLGEPGKAWKDIYVSDNTIYFDQGIGNDQVAIGIIKTSNANEDEYELNLKIKGANDSQFKNIGLGKGKVNKGNNQVDEESTVGRFTDLEDTNVNNLNDISGNFIVVSDGKIKNIAPSDVRNRISVYSKSETESKISNIQLELNNLSNVDTNNVQDEQYLKYDASTSKWVPSSITNDNIQGGSGNSDVVNNRNQTFFELLTQQPNQFTAGSTSSSSSQITINWNYDDIVPTHDVGVFAKLMFPSASADRLLPHIDEIRFDVSGVNTLNSNYSQFWVNDSGSTISLNSSNDYNSGSTYKSKIFPKTALSNANNSEIENILSKTSPIDIRVYGVVNNGIDFPNVNSRALVFRGLQFSEAAAPSQPIRQSVESISASLNSFSVNYRVSQTESGVSGSSARINEITGKYTELTGNDTLVSTIITQTDAGIEQTKTTSLNLLNVGQNLPITFNNLRFGTKYTYKVSVKNNFSSASSADSNIRTMSNFIKLPSAGSNNLNLNIHTDSLKNIFKPNSNLLSNIVYVNISETTGLKFANDNLQTFEVTDTLATTSSAGGVGKGVDDENDIVQIEISKNFNGGTYTSLQLIKYSGFNTSTNTVKNVSKSTNDIITNVTTNDKYSSDQLRKGFRIEGKFQLINIPSNNITNLIGGASSDPYGIRLSYTRTYNTGSNQTKEVYIDNLGSDPSITKTSGETFNITDQIYTMGIASVKEFNATFNRTYNNICSQYGFIPGDGKIGEITSIAGTNKSSSATSVTITSSEIPTSTPFNKTKQTTISNVFYNTGTLLSNSKTFVVKEKAFSLKKPDGIPSDGGSDTITTSHFCDRNSYNLSSNQIYSRKFNTSFYEITDTNELGKLNTNIGSIGVTEYSDTTHKTQIQSWTLLFIDGKLQTNNAQAYPDFSNSNFNQSGINNPSTYSSGTSSYDLTGTITNDDSGYKWIVFKIPKNNDSTGYKFAKTLGSTVESDITIKTNSSDFPYISLKDLFGNFFTSTTLEKLVDQSDVDVIGFCRANTGGNSNKTLKLGSFKKSYAPNTNWTSSGTSNIGYSSISNSNGCSVENGSDYGLYVNITSMDDDLEIFIGLKNNADL
jgi:hypothetical protein